MFEKEAFIDACLQAVRQGKPQPVIKEIVERAVRTPGDIDRALGAPTEGGIETLFRSDELTILRVVWAPGMHIFPHNHETWAVIGVYGGQEDNFFYRRRAEGIGLERLNSRSLSEEDTVVLGDKVIHAVTNPRHTLTGALHVYGGDFFTIPRSDWASEDAPEQPYSVERARQAFADANARAAGLLGAAQETSPPR